MGTLAESVRETLKAGRSEHVTRVLSFLDQQEMFADWNEYKYLYIISFETTSMEKDSVESIVRALNENRVQYLIAGGLAVVAHGYVRFTADLDLLLAMDEHNLATAVSVLQTLNYRPRAPVDFQLFIDCHHRRQWVDEKGLTVFSLFSPDHLATEIDLFVDPPLVFADAYSRAARMEISTGITATFCSFDDLINMKTQAGRPLDLEDIAQLRKLRGDMR
jgi:hypothetical protein